MRLQINRKKWVNILIKVSNVHQYDYYFWYGFESRHSLFKSSEKFIKLIISYNNGSIYSIYYNCLMCINMINIFNMDSTQDIVYLKVQKIYKTYYFSTFDKFTVLNSKALFFASVLLLLIFNFLLLDSALGCSFLSKPLFSDRLVVLYPPWNYWNPVNTPFKNILPGVFRLRKRFDNQFIHLLPSSLLALIL